MAYRISNEEGREALQGPIIMMAQNREAERDREYVRSLHLKLDLVLRKLEDV